MKRVFFRLIRFSLVLFLGLICLIPVVLSNPIEDQFGIESGSEVRKAMILSRMDVLVKEIFLSPKAKAKYRRFLQGSKTQKIQVLYFFLEMETEFPGFLIHDAEIAEILADMLRQENDIEVDQWVFRLVFTMKKLNPRLLLENQRLMAGILNCVLTERNNEDFVRWSACFSLLKGGRKFLSGPKLRFATNISGVEFLATLLNELKFARYLDSRGNFPPGTREGAFFLLQRLLHGFPHLINSNLILRIPSIIAAVSMALQDDSDLLLKGKAIVLMDQLEKGCLRALALPKLSQTKKKEK